MKSKNVALVLSSGGPRGLAFIGAIEELQRRGYKITSVAGTSMGSLVGGIFAAGGLEEFKEWIFTVDHLNMLRYLDVAISSSYIMKGERVIEALAEIIPDMRIEDLPIPYTALASDLYTGEAAIFRKGRLFDAIRASISVPSLFKPYRIGPNVYVDGGLVSTFPLGYVHRNKGDILVGFNVNSANLDPGLRELLNARWEYERIDEAASESLESIRSDDSLSLRKKIMMIGCHGQVMLRNRRASNRIDAETGNADGSYLSVISRSFGIANHSIAELEKRLYRPDVLAEMPFDSYRAIKDYTKAREISERGRALMSEALDRYEGKRNIQAEA